MSALSRHTLPDSGVHFSCERTRGSGRTNRRVSNRRKRKNPCRFIAYLHIRALAQVPQTPRPERVSTSIATLDVAAYHSALNGRTDSGSNRIKRVKITVHSARLTDYGVGKSFFKMHSVVLPMRNFVDKLKGRPQQAARDRNKPVFRWRQCVILFQREEREQRIMIGILRRDCARVEHRDVL